MRNDVVLADRIVMDDVFMVLSQTYNEEDVKLLMENDREAALVFGDRKRILRARKHFVKKHGVQLNLPEEADHEDPAEDLELEEL